MTASTVVAERTSATTPTRRVEVDGTRFAYRELGRRGGVPLVLLATRGSFDLAHRIPNARLVIYPDAGHGGVFQHHERFVPEVLQFLR
jgi:hypothetical protein